MAIILDLETVAIDGASDLVEPVSAPANYKDPEKIAAYIADAQKAQREKAALYPWTARIVALGYIDTDGDETVVYCQDETEEAAALTAFWPKTWDSDERFIRPIIGFNHRSFDLPVLLARSVLLGVKAPILNLDRYKTPHADLMEKLTWYGAIPSRSLTWFARRLGIPVTDTVKGNQIAGLVAEGQWDAVVEHCRSDVRLTLAVAQRLGVVRERRVAA